MKLFLLKIPVDANATNEYIIKADTIEMIREVLLESVSEDFLRLVTLREINVLEIEHFKTATDIYNMTKTTPPQNIF